MSDPILSSALDRVADRLEVQLGALHIPGLSAAIVYNQETAWARGFGIARLDSCVAADEHTIYHQASIGKLFTNTMMMQLRDDGVICLDDPIERYVPGFKLAQQANGQPRITLRHLASHTSGLPMEAPLDYVMKSEFPSIDTVLASLDDVCLATPPMTEFKYSNLGFALLGHALERASGQSYQEYLADRVLRPLEMTSSGFSHFAEVSSHKAIGYIPAEGDAAPTAGRVRDVGAFAPAGAVWASVTDMAKFISLQFTDGPAGGAQILSGTSLREMHAPIMFIDADWQEAIAFGGALARSGGWGGLYATGGEESFTSMIAYLPGLKLGMALAMNIGVNPGPLVAEALEELIPAVTQIQARYQFARTLMYPQALQRYMGHYSWPGVSELDVRLRDGVLVMET